MVYAHFDDDDPRPRLQARIAEAFPASITVTSVVAVEWPDGTTVSPPKATFKPNDVIILREFIPHKMMQGAKLAPEFPPRLPAHWDQFHDQRLQSLHNVWGDTERECDAEGR